MIALKRSLALLLAVINLFCICACGNEKKPVSSNVIESEIVSSEASSEEIKSSSENETSSLKEEISSKEGLSSKEETSSEEKTSSTKRPSIDRTSSQTESESVKVTFKNSIQIGMHGFGPGSNCYNLGKTTDDAYREFEEVIQEGYVTTVCTREAMLQKRFWDIVVKYDLTVWFSAWAIYDSSKRTLDKYCSISGNPVYKVVEFIKDKPEWWDRFNGFWYDEKIWRGETNDDFLAETKFFYQKYGKRNFAVLATGEFTGVEGNEDLIGTSAENMKKILPYAMEYLTDIAFDSYGVDVRDGVDLSHRLKDWQERISPNIVDGKTYYIEMTNLLLRLVNHDVNVWFYPCAYQPYSYAEEDYCLSHLKFFVDLLEKQKHQGGIFLYVYHSQTGSLEDRLIVKDDDNRQLLLPNEDKWVYYSQGLKKIAQKFRETDGNLVDLSIFAK